MAHDNVVGEGGFEPPKPKATDLQSAPFDRSGTLPCELVGAGGRIRTPDLLITNQLLYRLSYTSKSSTKFILAKAEAFVNFIFKFTKTSSKPYK